MSLRGFHVLFISLAVLCTVGFALWTLFSGADSNTGAVRIVGMISGFAGLGLGIYGVWFYKKKLNDNKLA